MSEWLTTGQMIDRLQVGEIAKKENSDLHIKRVTPVLYKFCREDGDTGGFREVTLDHVVVGQKWRILPNYVSFEEAMKALKKGQTVRCHPNWDEPNSHKITPDEAEYIALRHLEIQGEGLFGVVFESKWTIEGESNV